jgi:hypothetical protein
MPAQHEVIAANAGLTALLSYDSVWTGYAQNPEFAARSPFTTLEVARAFRGSIGKAVNHAQAIATVASDGDYEAIAESLREALSTYESGQIALQAIDEHAAVGNFGDRFLCGLAKASIAAGLITVWVPPHAHAAAAVGLGAAAYKAGVVEVLGSSRVSALPTSKSPRLERKNSSKPISRASLWDGCAPPVQEQARSKSRPKVKRYKM